MMGNKNTPSATVGPTSHRGERIAKIGTLISALLASSCCWLPLVLLAVGVSGAGIASALEEYRWIFMVVTFGFLAMAFYFTYRPRRAAAGAADCCGPEATQTADCCAPKAVEVEDCCAPQPGAPQSVSAGVSAGTSAGRRRFNMMALNKVMLWAVTVLAVTFLFFPGVLTPVLSGDVGEFSAEMTRTVLEVDGMTCETCVAPVAKAIAAASGVLAVKVDYLTHLATLGTAPEQPVPREEILSSLEAVGFSGKFTEP